MLLAKYLSILNRALLLEIHCRSHCEWGEGVQGRERKSGKQVYISHTFNALQIDKLNRKHLLTQKMHGQCEKRLANKVKIVENKGRQRERERERKRVIKNEWEVKSEAI